MLKMSGTAAATVVTAGAVAAPAAAQEEPPEVLFADDSLSGQVEASVYFLSGLADGAAATVTGAFDEQTDAIDTHVQAITDEFDAHTGDWLTYVNDRDLGGDGRETLGITFEYAGETRERYVVADYADGGYQSVAIQTPEEWSQGSADLTATVSDDAVENGADELRQLHDQYIEPNKDIERSYASELAGRYYWAPNDHVSASLLG
jgi:hypothetical protein